MAKSKDKACEFQILINESEDAGTEVELKGQLVSPKLDRSMHPDGKIDISIWTRGTSRDRRSGFLLDSFRLQSLLGYLEIQPFVRKILERELTKDQERVDPEGEPIRGDVWSWARVRLLGVYGPDRRKPKVRTSFVVQIDCDWGVDQILEATFRDGKFVEMGELG
jgi:hypothetical protein